MTRGAGRRVPAIALAAALVAAPAFGQPASPIPTPIPTPMAQPIDDAQALAPFFQALEQVKAGGRTRPVHVIQIGDSHTAADHITGQLRAQLQSRFGEGGRGALPPGRPFAAYNPRQITVEQSDGWKLEASFLPANWAKATDPGAPVQARGPFGLSGWRLVSAKPGATVTVKADPEARFERATLCALSAPDAGTLAVTVGDETQRVALAGPANQPLCRQFSFTGLKDRLELKAEGGPVTLLSFATFRSGGVAVSNMGVIGTRIQDFAARDDAILSAEFKAYAPDLIIMAFGTNDGFEGAVDAAAYHQVVKGQIERLRRLAPGVPVLMLGPPDANKVRPDIPEDGKANFGFNCAQLSPSEVADYARLVADKNPALARWYPPPALAIVRDAQRRAAEEEGAAFWDWSARMGGPCSAHVLSRADPRLVRGDHVHFTSDGGRLVADLLSGDLMQAYAAIVGQR